MIATMIAAAPRSHGGADLIVGLLLGAAIGFLVGPAIRSRLAYREWIDASRQADLTDELLTRMEQDRWSEDDGETGSSDAVSSGRLPANDVDRPAPRSHHRTAWRTSR